MEIQVSAWKCDECSHVWIKGNSTPKHCAKCHARKWNKDILDQAIERAPKGAIAVRLQTPDGTVIAERAVPARLAKDIPKAEWKHNKANCHVYGCLMCKES